MPSSLPANAKAVFQSDLLTVYQWPQTLYDGSVKTFECCVRPDCAVVLGFLNPDTILLTLQEQPHQAHSFFDLPGGKIESGEDVEAAAKREFLEETGYTVGRLEPWFIDKHHSLIHYNIHFFWGRDLSHVTDHPHLDAGERIKTFTVSREELRLYCLQDKLRNRRTSLAWLQLYENTELRTRLDTFLR